MTSSLTPPPTNPARQHADHRHPPSQPCTRRPGSPPAQHRFPAPLGNGRATPRALSMLPYAGTRGKRREMRVASSASLSSGLPGMREPVLPRPVAAGVPPGQSAGEPAAGADQVGVARLPGAAANFSAAPGVSASWNARPASQKGTRWLISREKRCWYSAISGVTLKISVADRSPPRRPAQWRAWHDGQRSGIRVREPGSRDTDADGRRVSRRLRRRAWPRPGLYLRLPAHAAPARASALARPAVTAGAGTGAGRAGSCVRERSATASHSADVQLFMIVTPVRDRCVPGICHGARVLVMRSPPDEPVT